MVNMYAVSGGLEIRTPYDPDFVQDLKRLPAADRRYNPQNKTWVVTANHGQEVADLLLRHFGFHVQVPSVVVNAQPEMRVLDVRYIGQAKSRGTGERTAYAWINGGWNAIFTESALRHWFEGEEEHYPEEAPTFYGVLGVRPKADESELKTAYRRMAKQYHPDLYHEPDAAERFRAIQHAYEVLSDLRMRARYDVGLRMSGEAPPVKSGLGDLSMPDYRSPLRCGLILAEGISKLGKFQVTKISQWADIQNSKGQTLVSSWPMGADVPEENWA